MSKCKKGDIVALEQEHSCYYAGTLKRDSYISYSLARVVSANREGVARKIQTWHKSNAAIDIPARGRVLVIPPQMQEAARRVFESCDIGATWDSVDSLKDAIRNMPEFKKALMAESVGPHGRGQSDDTEACRHKHGRMLKIEKPR